MIASEKTLTTYPQSSRFPSRSKTWFRSAWFRTSLIGVVFLAVVTGLLTNAPAVYIVGQLVLGCGVFISLWLLSDYPLINPVQAVIPAFYWWFGVGPAVIAAFRGILGDADIALYAQQSAQISVYIVAIGLPVYAFLARRTITWHARKRIFARFLLPAGRNYQYGSVVLFFFIGFSSYLILWLLSSLGMGGIEEINYLGGQITTVWWVGIIAGLGQILTIAKSSVLSELVQSGKDTSRGMKLMAAAVVLMSLFNAVTSGWKGAFVFIAVYILMAYVSKNQKLPWKSMFVVLLMYLFVVEPFVASGRQMSQSMGISTSQERSLIYSEMIVEGRMFDQVSLGELNVESPFRGISVFAGEVARRSTLLSGEWHGETLIWGVAAIVPRLLYPAKPEMNIGNFFAQQIGVDLGLVSSSDYFTNIAITIPFEFIGNYGLIAGILSFGLIGVLWASLCSWLLSPERLSDHPLTPWLTVSVLTMEAAVGHFLAHWRSMLLPFAVIYILRIFYKQKL